MTSFKRVSMLLFAVIICISCDAQQPAPSDIIKGVSFVATRDSITPTVVQPLTDYNANYIAVHPYGFLRDLENPAVRFNSERQWWGERVIGVVNSINIFRENNFKVMLKPQLWIGHGVYTGTIEMASSKQWDTLEVTYEKFILDYAEAAQQTNAEMFCIGTELESFVNARPEYWNQLIQKIRKVYKGKLTYAGNWDSYKRIPFWDQMDYIGVDAYFPVSDLKTPNVENAKAGWQPWIKELKEQSVKHGKKILFAEYGYVSADYAGKEPWQTADDTRESNEEAQQLLLQAQYDTIWNQEWFAGGFLWKHHAESGRRGFVKRFTPQGKLGQKTVTEAYDKY